MSRKPLSVRNSQDPISRPNAAVKKKARSHFPILDRPTLASQLNLVLKDTVSGHGPAKISEEDLKDPSPERVQAIYFRILQSSFDISINSLTQAPFSPTSSVVHKELMEDFVYRIQFFRAMKRLLHTCLENSFNIRDLVAPDSKRFCRHLCAFLNYTKYHHCVFNEDETVGSLTEEKEVLTEDYYQELESSKGLRKNLSALEKQRNEEHHLEEELKTQLASQRQSMQELKSREEFLKQQHREHLENQERSEQKLSKLTKQAEKFSLRVDDLMKQVVTSPDKIKAKLDRLRQEVEDASANSRDAKDLLRMWESLASQADQIPGGVLEVVSKNLDTLADKVKRRNDLVRDLETREEEMIRQSQLLQEATNKHQNLQQHLRNVREDSDRAAYQEGPSHTHELQRDILLLQQEVRHKEEESEKKLRELEADREKMTSFRDSMKVVYLEMEQLTNDLVKAFHGKVDQYKHSLESLGVEL